MTKQKSSRALLLSALSLLLCVSMLVGTTYAWFTDSVVSANNIIAAGNLDVVLEYKTNWADDWAEVTPSVKLFSDDARYEPGYTEVVFLRVSNAGSLALKYELKVDILNETPSTNVAGESFKLSDYLEIGTYVMSEYNGEWNYADFLFPGMFGTREAAVANIKSASGSGFAQLSTANSIRQSDTPVLPDDKSAQVAVLVLTMPETVGNEANHKTGVAAPQINLGVTLLATQHVHENDSFGPDYDQNATYPAVVNTAASLKAALEAGGYVELDADIDLGSEQLTIAKGKSVTLDLNGHDLTGAWNGADAYGMFTIKAGGELTVVGEGNVSATTNFTESNRYGAIFENGGKLTINGGNYTMKDSTSGKTWIISTIVDNRSTNTTDEAVLTINGGEFQVLGTAVNIFRNYPQQGARAAIIFNDGVFKVNPEKTNTYIWNQKDKAEQVAELYFNGGSYETGIVYEDYFGQSDIFFANGTVVDAYSGNS